MNNHSFTVYFKFSNKNSYEQKNSIKIKAGWKTNSSQF